VSRRPPGESLTERATGWFYERGMRRDGRGLVGKTVGYASWGAWMTLLLANHPIGKTSRLRTVARLWMWQVWRRTARRPIVVTLPGGARLLCPPESNIAGAWVAVGLHEYAEMLFVLDFLRPGDLFLDVGANLGIYTVLAARHGGRVVAFEPNGATRRTLRENVRLNAAGERVTIHPFALADYDGASRMNVEIPGSSHLLQDGAAAVGEGPTATVEVRRLDSVLESSAEPGLALLKVDAEGFDAEVLRGAVEFVRAEHPVVLVEIGDGGAEVRRWLDGCGYRVYFYREPAHRLEEIPAEYRGQGNFIAVHRDRLETVVERLRTGRRPAIAPPRVEWRASAAAAR
jgi:FkbM family methyltransferase